jgi:hypothetical protein
MPFANKFRAMMDLPFVGDTLGGFEVESMDVRHRSGELGYAYSVHMVLSGPGGQQGVRRAVKPLLCQQPTTFSGYGTPYQLWFGKPEIESLGNKRYAVRIEGAGARISLAQELDRFLADLEEQGQWTPQDAGRDRKALVQGYLDRYRAEIKRQVDRYRRKIRRIENRSNRAIPIAPGRD